VTISTLAVTVYLYMRDPQGFFPQQDNGRLSGSIQADQATSFQAMKERLLQINTIIKEDPAVLRGLNAFTEEAIGAVGGAGVNAGRMFITLIPLEERKISSDESSRASVRGWRSSRLSVFLQSTQTSASADAPAARSISTHCQAITSAI